MRPWQVSPCVSKTSQLFLGERSREHCLKAEAVAVFLRFQKSGWLAFGNERRRTHAHACARMRAPAHTRARKRTHARTHAHARARSRIIAQIQKNMQFHCRAVAKMKILIPTQHGDAKKKRAPRSTGSRFRNMKQKHAVSLQRCCKNENIDSHAAWGRQEKTSATQHGKPIPKNEAKTCSFTAEVLQK